jgi:pimeloyl-ACP methyl ester carboxylesterase
MLNSVESDSLYSLIDLNKVSEIASVIRYDACGKSVSGNYQWDAMTEQLKEVVEACQIDSMVIAGTSMGSVTALHYAVMYPEKVKALILVTPPPAWENREAVKAVYRKIASKVNQRTIPEFLKRLIALNEDPPDFFELEHPGTRQRLMEYRLEFDPLYYSQIYLGGAASDLPSRELIASIQAPTLIVALPDDQNHPLNIARELNGLIGRSELRVVSDYKGYLDLQNEVQEFLIEIGRNNKL